jgi:hypothetical protein
MYSDETPEQQPEILEVIPEPVSSISHVGVATGRASVVPALSGGVTAANYKRA